MDAFARMPDERLIIVGGRDKGEYSGAYARRILDTLPPNVTVISDLPEEKLIEYYGRYSGLVTTSRDEPFGMNAVEAMASGKPVVTVNEGGFPETIVDGSTGKLAEANAGAIAKAIWEASRAPEGYRDASVRRAGEKGFNKAVFLRDMGPRLIAKSPSP